MNNLKQYLPSKKFISILIIIVILITLFFAVKGLISLFSNRKGDVGTKENPIELTVATRIQKDSNDNGIADWEEYLWGLNPNKNGPENKEFINAKKKTLTDNGIITNIDDDSANITENEILSRELFATIISLQQTGELNEDSINAISEAVGQKIVVGPLPDIYTESMLNQVGDSPEAKENYFVSFIELAAKYNYEDIGSELTLISQGLAGNDPQALYAVLSIAKAYRAFGQDLLQIPVPTSFIPNQLSLVNNYEKNAQSIEGLVQIISDPIIGMRALINYKKYNDALVSDIEKISDILK